MGCEGNSHCGRNFVKMYRKNGHRARAVSRNVETERKGIREPNKPPGEKKKPWGIDENLMATKKV